MFCKNCGKELPDGAKFCSSCGTRVAPPEAPETPPIDLETPVAEFMAPAEVPEAGEEGQEIPAAEEAPAEEASAAEEVPAEEPPVGEEAPAEETGTAEGAPPVEETASAEEAPREAAPEEETAPAEAAPAAQSTPEAQAAPAAGTLPQFDAPTAESAPAKRRGKGAIAVIGVIAVMAIVAVVLLVRLVMGLVGSGGKAAYVYLNDDNELMYLADLNEKTQALELTDEAHYTSGVRFSPDGKTLYFTDTDSTLYKIAVAELKKNGRPERVARDVSTFYLLDDGRLVYTQYDDGSFKLSLYDGTESFRLIRDYDDYQIGSDQKTLYYTQQDDSDYTLTLYKMAMTKDAKGEKLLKGATSIYTDYDSSVLVYGEEEGMDSASSSADSRNGNTLTVYSCKPGEKAEKLVSDVYSVRDVTVDGGKVSFYYLMNDVEEHTLYDFVSDANAAADAALVEEGEPEYPYWSDYYPDELYLDGGKVYYSDRRGNSYPVDTTQLQLETGLPVEELYYWDVHDIAYADAEERYDQDMEDYNGRYDAWYAAWNREGVREDLKTTAYNQSSFSLYRYDNGVTGDPVATLINTMATAPADGVLLYTKVATVDSGKVADVADLSYYGEVYDLLDTGEAEGWFQNVGGKESAMDFEEEDTRIYGSYVLNGKELVLQIYDGYESSLRAYSIGKDALSFTTTIVEGDDFTVCGVDGGMLYLFTDIDDDGEESVGDFCTYSSGKLETVVKEVYGVVVLEDGTIYVGADAGSRGVELALLKDGKLTTITDEMDGEPIFLDSKQMLYISDDDLYLWDGKESRRVARDVERVWASAQMGYSTYEPYSGPYYYGY